MFNGGEGLFETLINKFVMKKIRSIIMYSFQLITPDTLN